MQDSYNSQQQSDRPDSNVSDQNPQNSSQSSTNQKDQSENESNLSSVGQKHLADNLLLMEYHLLNALDGTQPSNTPQLQSKSSRSTLNTKGKSPFLSQNSSPVVLPRKKLMKSTNNYKGYCESYSTLPSVKRKRPSAYRKKMQKLKNKFGRFKRNLFITWEKKVSRRTKLGCFWSLVVLLIVGVVITLSLLLPNCSALGCKRDYLAQTIAKEISFNGNNIILNRTSFQNYPNLKRLFNQSLGISNIWNNSQIVIMDYKRPTSVELGISANIEQSIDQSFLIGRPFCGKLSPYNDFLGFPNQPMSSIIANQTMNVTEILPQSYEKENKTYYDGIYAQDLASCCLVLASSSGDWFLHDEQVHGILSCYNDGEQSGWKGLEGFASTNSSANIYSYFRTVPSNYQNQISIVSSHTLNLNDQIFREGFTYVSRGSISTDLIGSAQKFVRDQKWIDGNVQVSFGITEQNILDISSFYSWMSIGPQYFSLNVFPDIPNYEINGASRNQRALDILLHDGYFIGFDFNGNYVPVDLDGCPKKYYSNAYSCIRKDVKVQVFTSQFLDKIDAMNQNKLENALVTNFKFYGQDSISSYPLRSFPILIEFRQPNLNRTGFLYQFFSGAGPYAYIMKDGSCPGYSDYSSFDKNFGQSQWSYLNVKRLPLNGTQWEILGSNMRGMIYQTSCRLGDISFAVTGRELASQDPFEVRFQIPNCEEDQCIQMEWVRINPPYDFYKDSLWNLKSSSLANSFLNSSTVYLTNKVNDFLQQMQQNGTDHSQQAQEKFMDKIGYALRTTFGTDITPGPQNLPSEINPNRLNTTLFDVFMLQPPQDGRIVNESWIYNPTSSLEVFTLDTSQSNPDIFFYLQLLSPSFNKMVNFVYNFVNQNLRDQSIEESCIQGARQMIKIVGNSNDGAGVTIIKPIKFQSIAKFESKAFDFYYQIVTYMGSQLPLMSQLIEKFYQNQENVFSKNVPRYISLFFNSITDLQMPKSFNPQNYLYVMAANEVLTQQMLNITVQQEGSTIEIRNLFPILLNKPDNVSLVNEYQFCFNSECLDYDSASTRLKTLLDDTLSNLLSQTSSYNVDPLIFPYQIPWDDRQADSLKRQWITRIMTQMMNQILSSQKNYGDEWISYLMINPRWIVNTLQLVMVSSDNKDVPLILTTQDISVVKILLSIPLLRTDKFKFEASELIAEGIVELQ